MAAASYTYQISADFSNGKVSPTALAKEILASAISVAFDHIDTTGDTCVVWFKDALSMEDTLALDSVVAGHMGAAPVSTDAQYVAVKPTGLATGKLVIRGARFVADMNKDTTHDVSFSEVRWLQGAQVEVSNVVSGDYMELTVEHPTLGVVAKFGETVYLPPSGSFLVISESSTELPAGYILRTLYHSSTALGTPPVVVVHFRLWH